MGFGGFFWFFCLFVCFCFCSFNLRGLRFYSQNFKELLAIAEGAARADAGRAWAQRQRSGTAAALPSPSQAPHTGFEHPSALFSPIYKSPLWQTPQSYAARHFFSKLRIYFFLFSTPLWSIFPPPLHHFRHFRAQKSPTPSTRSSARAHLFHLWMHKR